MKLAFASALIILLISLGCSKDPISSVDQKTDVNQNTYIWPLSVGTELHGTSTSYDSTGAILSETLVIYATVGDTILNGEKWYFNDIYFSDSGLAGNYIQRLVTNREDGFYTSYIERTDSTVILDDQPFLWLKYPADTGDLYHTGYVDTIQVLSVDVPVSTHYISSASIDYSYTTFSEIYEDHFYAIPGIGLVKRDIRSKITPKIRVVWELEKIVHN